MNRGCGRAVPVRELAAGLLSGGWQDQVQRSVRMASLGNQRSMPTEDSRLPERERLEGRYTNYFKVGHNAFEFVLEFAQSYSEPPEEQAHTRIITSPVYAKELLAVLQRAISDYERVFGSIPGGHSK
jgi:Protein of unknown function (DUF3467)